MPLQLRSRGLNLLSPKPLRRRACALFRRPLHQSEIITEATAATIAIRWPIDYHLRMHVLRR